MKSIKLLLLSIALFVLSIASYDLVLDNVDFALITLVSFFFACIALIMGLATPVEDKEFKSTLKTFDELQEDKKI